MSCDSLVNSDYKTALVEDTDGADYTKGKGGLHPDMEEGSPATALAQSLEPVLVEEPQSLLDHETSSGHQGAQNPLTSPVSFNLEPQEKHLWSVLEFLEFSSLRGASAHARPDPDEAGVALVAVVASVAAAVGTETVEVPPLGHLVRTAAHGIEWHPSSDH
ncbi:Tight Junction Protein Zo-3 [Manis pentadactyla]|nr:Tight Junction Protein Zo-3 [Manis pentadactyla]